MERIYHFAITLAIGYFCVLLLLRIFESHLIYFPNYPGRLTGDWQPRGLPVEDVWIAAQDGTRLHAWWIPAEKASFTFLAFHGNAGNISDRAYVYGFLRSIPANVLALEYRGYGKSGGTPGEKDSIATRNPHSLISCTNGISILRMSFRLASRWEPRSLQIWLRKTPWAELFWRRRFRRLAELPTAFIGSCRA